MVKLKAVHFIRVETFSAPLARQDDASSVISQMLNSSTGAPQLLIVIKF